MKKIAALSTVLVIGACASSSNEIATSYVSPMQYEDYSCKQISYEMQRVSRRTSEISGVIDKKASNDSAQMGLGLVLFWPALFFLEGGDGPEAAEYARLKGEFDALETVGVQKDCGIEVKRPEPVKAKEAGQKGDYDFKPKK